MDLGFGFEAGCGAWRSRLAETFPTLDLYYAVNCRGDGQGAEVCACGVGRTPAALNLASEESPIGSPMSVLFPGKDLDAVLKATPILPEKEARIIIVQIFQGLVYLNKRAQKTMISNQATLSSMRLVLQKLDFVLSKIVEDDVGSQGMELTSQGAGTYW